MNYNQNFIQPIVRIIIHRQDHLLIVKRSSSSHTRAGEWEIPGGRVDSNENYEQAVMRETKEETGIDIITSKQLKFVKSEQYKVGEESRIVVYFAYECDTDEVQLSSEHDDYSWVSIDNFDNIKLNRFHLAALRGYFDTDVTSYNDEKNTTENYQNDKLIVYTDGGSRGNPGPSATGYVIANEAGDVIVEGGDYLGITTNNQAEYQAVRTALEMCLELNARSVDFFIDSLLVVNQMNGLWKIKNRDLWPIHERITQLTHEFASVTFTHVRREKNKLADAKVNEVLDNHIRQ